MPNARPPRIDDYLLAPHRTAGFGRRLAEIVAGSAALGGLYLARMNLAIGAALVAGSGVAMAFIATWALPGIIVISLALTVISVIRWYAPMPTTAMPA